MAEADLSKIVNLIMENPHIIDEIKKLSEDSENKSVKSDVPLEASEEGEKTEASFLDTERGTKHTRRRELLSALKPYVSGERGQAIESMMTIADILEAMGRK